MIVVILFLSGCANKNESVYLNSKNYGQFEYPQIENECSSNNDCHTSGCSGEACVSINETVISTCVVPEGIIVNANCLCINKKCIWVKD